MSRGRDGMLRVIRLGCGVGLVRMGIRTPSHSCESTKKAFKATFALGMLVEFRERSISLVVLRLPRVKKSVPVEHPLAGRSWW